ncbi:MAG: glutathione S-transferase, partial [Pseudomonadota bacterium]
RLAGKSAELNLGTMAVVAALGYADWRHAENDWRHGHDNLSKWFDDMMQIPDVAATHPKF